MSAKPRVTLLVIFGLSMLLLAGCEAPPRSTSSEPTVPAVTQSTPDLSKSGDEYSRPPSSSSHIPEGATLDPNTVYTPTINITRSDYEAALAKWRAQNISDYEIAVGNVALAGHGTILRVLKGETSVLGYYYSDNPVVQEKPESPEPSEYDLENTVEGLFRHVDSILTYGICPLRGAMAFPIDYTIEFDQTIGYPSRIERRGYVPKEWADQRIFSTMPAHSSYWKSVQKFTVIK